jgi:hypothetical protein
MTPSNAFLRFGISGAHADRPAEHGCAHPDDGRVSSG